MNTQALVEQQPIGCCGGIWPVGINKQWVLLVAGLALLQGCASTNRDAIPVTEAGRPVEASGRIPTQTTSNTTAQPKYTQPSAPVQDSGVVVMVPQGNNPPLQVGSAAANAGISVNPPPVWNTPSAITTTPTIPPSAPTMPTAPVRPLDTASVLAADEQLDGPVLALLTTAQQLQGNGDLNGAASSLERAQRIAPREPQVLYRLALIRLNQGDAAQAEQLSRRALSYAAGRPALQAGLWDLIAQAREKQGDPAGAAQARQRAKVSL